MWDVKVNLILFAKFLIEMGHVISLFLYYWIKPLIVWVIPKKYKTIRDEVVLITGGGKGLGRCLAIEFAKFDPGQMILWGRNEEPLKETSDEICLLGVSCDYMVCDVGDREQVFAQARSVQDKYGPVTILVNNAGMVNGGRLVDLEPEEIENTFRVNTFAHFWTIKSFLPSMLERNQGHIVNINSTLGLMGALPRATDYIASKFASHGLAEALFYELRAENKKCNIQITSIHPYLINTPMFAGCQLSSKPFLFAPLDQQYVARRTVEAVLTNQHSVVMPRFMYLSCLANSLLPKEAIHILLDYMGVNKSMDHFQGHSEPAS